MNLKILPLMRLLLIQQMKSTLKEIGIKNFDHVIVAIGENIQASILTTVIIS